MVPEEGTIKPVLLGKKKLHLSYPEIKFIIYSCKKISLKDWPFNSYEVAVTCVKVSDMNTLVDSL